MFVWNRTEVVTTLSKEYYMQVRATLHRNQIRMQSKEIPQKNNSEEQEMLQRPVKEYHIYVHSDDVERVQQILSELESILEANIGTAAE